MMITAGKLMIILKTEKSFHKRRIKAEKQPILFIRDGGPG